MGDGLPQANEEAQVTKAPPGERTRAPPAARPSNPTHPRDRAKPRHYRGRMSDPAEVLVIGAGVVGLTTAVELLARGRRVEVWTRDAPSATTSAVAAALWYPFLAEPRARVLTWSRATYEALARQAVEAPESGVRMTRFVECFRVDPRGAPPDLWWESAVPSLRHLPRAEIPEGFDAAIEVEAPVADTRAYLPWLVSRVRALGGVVREREVRALAEAQRCVTRAVVNCTGLGARALCGDDSLVPVRGQVLVARGLSLSRGLVVDSGARPIYVIPRGDEVILGGTAQVGDARLTHDAQDTEAILAGAAPHVPGLTADMVRGVKVGLRPWRPAIRLERERGVGGALLIHNYGHGGSGYTVAWGCAREAADLVELDP